MITITCSNYSNYKDKLLSLFNDGLKNRISNTEIKIDGDLVCFRFLGQIKSSDFNSVLKTLKDSKVPVDEFGYDLSVDDKAIEICMSKKILKTWK